MKESGDMTHSLPVLGFAAFSGTGKTSLLKNLIPALKNEGLAVAVIKHAHHGFEIDIPGKDSYELRLAGADQVIISSAKRFVKIEEVKHELSLHQCLSCVSVNDTDLVLVEGYKTAAISKIELHRPSLGFPLLYQVDRHIIAVASDDASIQIRSLPLLDLNDTVQIAKFVISKLDGLRLPLNAHVTDSTV